MEQMAKTKYIRPSQRGERLGDDSVFMAWMADLDTLAHSQLPFALSLTVNDALFAARKKVVGDYKGRYDRGVNYFRKGLAVEKSHKKQPVIHGILGESTGYMYMQQHGYHKAATAGGMMAIPTHYTKKHGRTKGGKMKKSWYPKKLVGKYKGPTAAGKFGGRGKQHGRGEWAFFPMKSKATGTDMIVARRRMAYRAANGHYSDSDFQILYIYTPIAKIQKGWAFDILVLNEARYLFPKRLVRHLNRAIRTAK
jgi:hypothetical protein